MQTVQQIAEAAGVHVKTVRRKILKHETELFKMSGAFPYSSRDIVPDEAAAFLLSALDRAPDAVSVRAPVRAPVRAEKRPHDNPRPWAVPVPIRKSVRERNRAAHEELFSSVTVMIASASVLILVDAVSFGWIAWNVYPGFAAIAVPIFALAGMATGYSAFKSILAYRGWNGDGWILGFGLFQLALHLCAMQAIGEYSFPVGKIVIAIGLPLASAGLALAIKNSADEKLA